MRKSLVLLIVLGLLMAVVGAAPASGSPAPQPTLLLSHPGAITRDHYDATVILTVGQSFTLALGENPPQWNVEISDPEVLSRVVNLAMVRGAQGVYTAHKPGTVQLNATGVFPCQLTVPRCMIASPFFTVTVIVQPARTNRVNFTIGQEALTVNGQAQEMPAAAFIEGGRAYLPVRFLARALGVADENIEWMATGKEVLLKTGETSVVLRVGDSQFAMGTTAIVMDAPVVLRGDRTYVPARWLAEALGYRVTWDAETETVAIEP